MQSPDQSADQLPEQPPRPWWWFPKGVSGNPRGHGLRKDRIVAETEALVHDFVAAHGRAPRHSETADIANLARLQVRLRARSLSAEDMVKLNNSLDRKKRRLGLHKLAPAASPTVPLPTKYAEQSE